MKQWMQDPLLTKLFKNAGVLFSGNVVASILSLVSLAITSRILGAELFGVLVLISTYVLIVDSLCNFQSWQAVIKYGADALEHRRDEDFKALIKFGFLLDGGTAILGAIVAASAAWFVGGLFGWDDEHVLMAVVYSITLLFHISGTPIAILRLFERYRKTAIQQVYEAAFKLAGVTLAFLVDAGLWGFILVWAATDILGKLLILYYSYQELLARNITQVSQSSIAGVSERFRGIWGFVWTTNINASIRMSIREADIMLVGALIGPSGAGLFRVVKISALLLGKVADVLYNSIYPEIAKLISVGDYRSFRRLALRASVISGIVALVLVFIFWWVGEAAILVILGVEYQDAYMPLIVYMFSQVVWMVSYPLSAAVLAFGIPQISLYVLLLSGLVYFPSLYILTSNMGLMGASLAAVIFYCLWSSIILVVVSFVYLKRARALSG